MDEKDLKGSSSGNKDHIYGKDKKSNKIKVTFLINIY
ncbi:hypothetical protein [Plasmodium yoelii yoelii]|uniref:Uncharacterized protein n=1 Tax=Plasmodium yoelii yoelii TaxID=73239 RepID=Q7RIB5_PLAYO|nr:hypothetical protein [Plasmodium yoelii yoelii]